MSQSAEWNTVGRRAIESKAMSWLTARRHWLDHASVDERRSLLSRKAFIEISLLVGLYARENDENFIKDRKLLLELIKDVAERPSYRELVVRDPRSLLLYAATYSSLKLCGIENGLFRDNLIAAIKSRYATIFERSAFRQLDLMHTFELAEIEDAGPKLNEILPYAIASQSPNIYQLECADYYAITHTIFYASDFGHRKIDWPCTTSASQVIDEVRSLLLITLGEKNADLVAEMLCSLSCLGFRQNQECSVAWQWLGEMQESTGRIDGPKGFVLDSLIQEDPEWGNWATAYHTTTVVALASFLDRHTILKSEWNDKNLFRDPTEEIANSLQISTEWLLDKVQSDCQPSLIEIATVSLGLKCSGCLSRLEPMLRRLAMDIDRGSIKINGIGADALLGLALAMRATNVTCHQLATLACDTANVLTTMSGPTEAMGATSELLRELGYEVKAASTTASVFENVTLTDIQALCRLIIQSGYAPDIPPVANIKIAATLAKATKKAISEYNLGQLALLIRALIRIKNTPFVLAADAAAFLGNQIQRDGSIGAPAIDDSDIRMSLIRPWTLTGIVALSEYVQFSRNQK
jgi:hypothetical protein